MDELRVALVGGAPLVQAGMAAVLGQDARFQMVFQAPDVPSALELLRQVPCDVVVLNTEAPRVDVAALLCGLAEEAGRGAGQAAGETPRILALTDEESPEEALATLKTGAHGYGLRSCLFPEDLHAGTMSVARGRRWTCAMVTSFLIRQAPPVMPVTPLTPVMPLAHEGQAGERHASGRGGLSSRELEVLCQAAHGEGDSGIATALSLSRNSVKTYWQRIREKLAVKTREEALREAVMQGLIPDRRRRHSYADGMAESLGTAALSGFTMTSV